jgi:predicted protein tyrosine phosphatase
MVSKALSKKQYELKYKQLSWHEVCGDMNINWTDELEHKWDAMLEGAPFAGHTLDDEYYFYKEYLVPLQTKLARYLNGVEHDA